MSGHELDRMVSPSGAVVVDFGIVGGTCKVHLDIDITVDPRVSGPEAVTVLDQLASTIGNALVEASL